MSTPMTKMDPEREEDRWFNRISQHLTGIGLVIGGELVILGLLYKEDAQYLPHEKAILTTIVLGIALQSCLWLRQLLRDRQIAYEKYGASLYSPKMTSEDFARFQAGEARTNTGLFTHHMQKAFQKQTQNTLEGKWLDQSIWVSIFLILLMFLLKLWK